MPLRVPRKVSLFLSLGLEAYDGYSGPPDRLAKRKGHGRAFIRERSEQRPELSNFSTVSQSQGSVGNKFFLL